MKTIRKKKQRKKYQNPANGFISVQNQNLQKRVRFKKHKTKLYMKNAKKENWSPSVVKSCVIRKRGKRETVSGYNQVEFVGLYNDEMKMGVDYGFQNEYFGFGKTSNGYFYVD